MKKLLPTSLALLLGLGASVFAQELTLDPQRFVNAQIAADTLANGRQAHSVYKVQSGTYYAFDGALDVDFDLVIEGPNKGWILRDPNPPVFFQLPSLAGAARDMINLNQGGSVTLKNILLTGLLPNDVNISSFVRNFAGYKIVWDNCVFTDHRDHATRTTGRTEEITITNCVFLNGDRRGPSPFGGMPYRLDAACKNLTFENNTVVNSGRLLGNGGDFFTSKQHELHNSFLNQQVSGHEIHWFEGIQANNIFYNWSFRGRKATTNTYEEVFTTVETFANVKFKLDSIALYQGRNLFYLEPAFTNFWHTVLADSVFPCYLWNLHVDSTILADDNFTIGKSYGEFDPMFTNNPSKIDSMLWWSYAAWVPGSRYPDWRVTPPVTWNTDGTPKLNWPPAWDLTYANTTLQTAGTDGLPLGDLNWWPAAKATYLANRAQYIAALRDSIANAKHVYIPGNPASALITPTTSVEESYDGIIPTEFSLEQNYPNPFNPTTNIVFNLPKLADVKLTVYSLLGQRIAVLIDNEKRAAGKHTVQWDGRDKAGNLISSGIYLVRLETGQFTAMRKIVLMK